jgi:hypothetical protein
MLPTIMEEEEIGDGPRIAGAGGGVAGGRMGKQMGDGGCQGKQRKGPNDLLVNDTSETNPESPNRHTPSGPPPNKLPPSESIGSQSLTQLEVGPTIATSGSTRGAQTQGAYSSCKRHLIPQVPVDE